MSPREDLRPIASGGAGTVVSFGQIEDLDPNPETRGDLWFGDANRVGLAAQMMRDPHVRQSVGARVSPLVGASWDAEPVSDDPLDLEIADAVRWAFFERLDWHSFIYRSATGWNRDGFTLSEFTDDVCDVPVNRFPLHPGRGKGVAYTGIHDRPAHTVLRWIQSPTNPAQIVGVEQYIRGSDEETPGPREVRLDRGALLWRLTVEQEGSDFEGFAPLRSAWGAFKKKRLIATIAMIRHEREGAPIAQLDEPDPGMGLSSDKSEREIADEIAKNLRAHEQAFLRLPPGWKFRWIPPMGPSTGLAEAEAACNFDIAYNMGVGWMLLSSGNSSATGSRALAVEQKGQYILGVEREARLFEYAINVGQDGFSPVERFVRLNYGPTVGVPRIVARNMPLKDFTGLLAALPQLVQTGVVRSDDKLRAYVRTVTSLPREDSTTAERWQASGPGMTAPTADPAPKEAA